MKKTVTSTISVILSIVLILCLVSCEEADKDIWENATYKENATVGNGEKTVIIDVIAADKTVTITLKTNKTTLGEALYEQGLINDQSFFDVLNGIKADWDKNQVYWKFLKGEETMMVGVNDTEISGGEHFRFVYSK